MLDFNSSAPIIRPLSHKPAPRNPRPYSTQNDDSPQNPCSNQDFKNLSQYLYKELMTNRCRNEMSSVCLSAQKLDALKQLKAVTSRLTLQTHDTTEPSQVLAISKDTRNLLQRRV